MQQLKTWLLWAIVVVVGVSAFATLALNRGESISAVWIIVAAVFLYKVSVKTGQFDIIRSSILSVTEDQRLQLILVGFCFGAFLETRRRRMLT